jgi:hypothetical protein
MPEQREDGSWSDGVGGVHSTEAGAYDADNARSGGGSAASAAAGDAMAGGLLAVFLYLPILAGKLVGLLWGLLLKLGLFGKIVTSLLTPFAVLFTIGIIAGTSGMGKYAGGRYVWDVLMVAMFLITPVWYFLWHSDTVKKMGALKFSSTVQTFCKYLWWGFIAAGILAVLGKYVGFLSVFAKIGAGLLSLGFSVAGLINYIITTRPYARAVVEEREAAGKPSLNGLKAIVMAITIGIVAIIGVAATIENIHEDSLRTAAEAGTVIVKPAKNKAQREIAANYVPGATFKVFEDRNIFTEPNENSTPIGEVKDGDWLTSTGVVLFDPNWNKIGFAEIEYNGTKAWVGKVNLENSTVTPPR